MKKYFFSFLFLFILFIWFFTKSTKNFKSKNQILEEKRDSANANLKVHNQEFVNSSSQNEKVFVLTATLHGSHFLTKLSPQSESAIKKLSAVCLKKLEQKVENSNYKNQTIQNLNQNIIGEWFFSDLEDMDSVLPPVSIIDKFYQALAMTNLLESKKIRGSYDQALKLLHDVHLEDPNNSAPLLFSSLIELRRGRRAESLKWLNLARKLSDHYNSYVTILPREIFKAVNSGEDYLNAISLWSQAPIPKVSELSRFLNTQDSIVFAHQLMQDGLNDSLTINDLEWSILDYAVGARIYKQLEPNKKIPTHNEISKRKDSFNPISKYNIFELLGNNCDINSLDKISEIIRVRLINDKSNL